MLDAARLSEGIGLPAFAMPDHYFYGEGQPAHDALIQFAALARDTSSIELVSLVSPITFRHPAVLLKTAVTIAELSGDRFSLGVGTGWMDREHELFGFDYPPLAERFTMLEEALAYLRAGLDPDAPGYRGDRYRLEPEPAAPLGRVKLVVGGGGRQRTPYLAGTYADEFNVSLGPGMAERIDRAQVAAVEAGRDPDDVFLSSAGWVIGADDEAGLDAIIRERADAAGVTPDEFRTRIANQMIPIGTWEQIRDLVGRIEAEGIRRFYVQGAYDRASTSQLLERLGA